MRAYEMRPDGVTARVDDSAEDSMKYRSLTEDRREMGGRAHRRDMVPRFRVLSNPFKRAIGVDRRSDAARRQRPRRLRGAELVRSRAESMEIGASILPAKRLP